jgi:CRP/FNR family transcriptional regulator, cyclic AMP receptor protein
MTTRIETVLDRLSTEVSSRLAPVTRPLAFDAGATVLREGVDTGFLGVLLSGRVALRLRVPELGDRITIVTIEPGELIGWSAVVPPFRATVDAVATESTRLLAIDAVSLRALLAADAELAAELLPLILESVSDRLGATWDQLLDMYASRETQPW